MVTQADARGPRGNYPVDQHEIYCRHACSDRANGGGEEGRGSNDCGRKNDATRRIGGGGPVLLYAQAPQLSLGPC